MIIKTALKWWLSLSLLAGAVLWGAVILLYKLLVPDDWFVVYL